MVSCLNKLVLVTGASRGIGREIALHFASRGARLVLASRNPALLETVRREIIDGCGVEVTVIPVDLSLPGGAEELHGECGKRGLQVDILVNNAGIGMFDEAVAFGPERAAAMVNLNNASLTVLSILFGREMKNRGGGYILNIGSMAARYPMPYFSVYAASKAYVHSFTLSLRSELRPAGVGVTCLEPGFVATDFDANAGIRSKKYLRFSRHSALDARTVARCAVRAVLNKRAVVIPGFFNRVTLFFSRLIPTAAKTKLLYTFGSRMRI